MNSQENADPEKHTKMMLFTKKSKMLRNKATKQYKLSKTYHKLTSLTLFFLSNLYNCSCPCTNTYVCKTSTLGCGFTYVAVF